VLLPCNRTDLLQRQPERTKKISIDVDWAPSSSSSG
jgi:hypothetical protein